MENENRETPCDCAEKQHHKELALCLESQMVFSIAPEAEGIEAEYAALDRREVENNISRGSGYSAFTLSSSTGVTTPVHSTVPSALLSEQPFPSNCCLLLLLVSFLIIYLVCFLVQKRNVDSISPMKIAYCKKLMNSHPYYQLDFIRYLVCKWTVKSFYWLPNTCTHTYTK